MVTRRFWLLLLVLLLTVPAALARAAAPPVSFLSVVAGFAGKVREGYFTPLAISVSNHGKQDVTGVLVAKVPAGLGSQVSESHYRLPVVLPAGSRKTLTIPVFLGVSFGPTVEFEYEGKLYGRTQASTNMLAREAVLAGVLSDEPGAFASLAGARIPGRHRIELVNLTAETLPDDPVLLEPLDLIAVGRYDTSKLTSRQRTALSTWVGRGGLLVISAGPEWRATLSGLPAELLPVAVSDSTRVQGQEFADFGGVPLSGTIPVAVGRLERGSALASEGDMPLIALQTTGRGTVAFLAADVALEPLHGWKGMQAVWEQLLNPLSFLGASSAPRFLGPIMPTEGMAGALQRVPQMGLPAPGTLLWLLGLYLLLIGPVTYFVLRRIDRREWAWGVIPATAALFIGTVSFGFTQNTTGMHHAISLTEVLPDAQAVSRTYVGVFAPATDQFAVQLPTGQLATGLLFDTSQQGSAIKTSVTMGSQTEVEITDNSNWALKGFQTVQQVRLSGGLQFQVSGLTGGRLTGTLINRTGQTLNDVVAVSSAETQKIGEVPNGGAKSISIAIGQASGTSPVFQLARQWSPDPNEARRRDVIAHLFNNMRDADSPLQVTVYGWSDESFAPVQTNQSLGRATLSTNLVYARFMPQVDLAKAEIPSGILMGRLVSTRNGQPPAVSGQTLKAGPGVHTFEFTLPPLNRRSIGEVALHFGTAGQPLQQVTLRAHNWKTRAWIDLPLQAEQSLAQWADLIAPNGTMTMEVTVTGQVDLPLPSLSLKGGRP